jgi:hypothetical protein
MSYPPDERAAGRVLDARLHLLDRQLLDVDDVPVHTLDDLEILAADGTEDPVGTRAGPVLGTRIFGLRPPSSRLERIPWRDVRGIGTAVQLGVRGDSLDASWVERWVRDKVIGRIPGGRHDPE